jgi:hypothetical protein
MRGPLPAGQLADVGQCIGKASDGGIDGIIKEDRLGLDVVCIQARRREGTVGRPVVQAFVRITIPDPCFPPRVPHVPLVVLPIRATYSSTPLSAGRSAWNLFRWTPISLSETTSSRYLSPLAPGSQ